MIRIKIAIDGPAASGKSTTARRVAKRLNYLYIDSGAMYRAVTLKALQAGIPTTDRENVARLAEQIKLEFQPGREQTTLLMDGNDISLAIRSPEIVENINPVAANPLVRNILVSRQQELGRKGGVVMDGRDITTVVFPDAELKIFMNASAEERARRRVAELAARGLPADYRKVLADIQSRDHADISREHGPLLQAEDAIVLDTTHLTIEEQVEKIYQLAMERIAALSG